MKQSIFIKIYIFPMVLMSPFIMISCNSWFSIWMIMELNLMSFVPLIIFLNKFYKEVAFKYFIIQSISSSFLILAANILLILNPHNLLILMINMSILMKLGFPPFHKWFINIMNNMNWLTCLILSTWQKIIPMISLMYIYMKYIQLIMIIYGSALSAIMALNHQSLRIIFAYSSINHMSWMILNLMISEMMWLMYFLMYSIMNFSIIMILHKFNIYFINQLFMLNNFKNLKLILFFNLLSISGLPPMFGFFMKWMSIYFITVINMYLVNLYMILMSTLTFIFYTRIIISYMLFFSTKNKLTLINKFTSKNFFIFMFLVSFMNLWLVSIWLF